MSNFILVWGQDYHYKARESLRFIHLGSIVNVIPEWAVESNGQWFRCVPEHEGAQLYSFLLLTSDGGSYRCPPKQFKNYLSDEQYSILTGKEEKRRIGFQQLEEGPA